MRKGGKEGGRERGKDGDVGREGWKRGGMDGEGVREGGKREERKGGKEGMCFKNEYHKQATGSRKCQKRPRNPTAHALGQLEWQAPYGSLPLMV